MSISQSSFLSNFIDHARKNPDAVFCNFISRGKVKEYSYAELLSNSISYSHLLKNAGINQGEIVIIILEHCPDLYFSFLGAMLAGCIPSFLPFQTPKQDTAVYWKSQLELFKRIKARALITYEANLELLKNYLDSLDTMKVFTPSDLQRVETKFEINKDQLLSGEAIAFLQHSSGTTGFKKGVALSYQAVTKQIVHYSKAIDFSAKDKIVTWLPLYHDMGLIASFIIPVSSGVEIVAIDPFEWVMRPGMLFDAIEKFRCTLCWLPNFAFHHLIRLLPENKNYDLSSIRSFINCSEPCKAETFLAFFERFKKDKLKKEALGVCYAMAEAVYAVTTTKPGVFPRVLEIDVEDCAKKGIISKKKEAKNSQVCISAGKPIDGIKVRIMADEGNVLAENKVGEIALQGEFLFSAYFRDPETTAKKFKDAWYYTGDLGFIEEGELFVLGRKDDVIISHGKKFAAHDLEQVVHRVSGVKPGRVIALSFFEENVGSDEIVIIAEKDPDSKILAEETIKSIKKTIFDEFGISIWEARAEDVGWIIKTTSGKLCRKENLEKFRSSF